MKKAGALASALRNSGATVAALAFKHETSSLPTAPIPPVVAPQPSRVGTKAITVHFPEKVRRQLKTLAAEEGRNIEDMVARGSELVVCEIPQGRVGAAKSQYV
jgi:hypothetical protein